jgi:U3 small nucleolar RNA-associated protein 20
MPNIMACLNLVCEEMEEMQAANADEVIDDDSIMFRYWDAGYYSLITVGKIVQFPASFALLDQWHEELLDILTKLLLHPHQWIRSASSRVFGILFSQLDGGTLVPLGNSSSSAVFSERLLGVEGGLYNLGIFSAVQLQSKHVSVGTCTQVVKNLLFVGKCMHANAVCDTVGVKDGDVEEACRSTSLARLIKKLAYFCRSATKNCEHTRTRLLVVCLNLS